MTRKHSLICLLLALSVVFTGCAANAESTIIIKTNGTASQSIYVNIDRQAYLLECGDGEELSTTEIEDIDANFTSRGASLVTIGGLEYYRLPVVESNKMSNQELLTNLYIPGSVAYATGDTFYWNVSVEKIMAVEFSDDDLSSLGVTREEINSLPVSLTVQFSGEITSTNGTICSDNGKKVVFNISNEKNAPMFATTDSTKTQTSVVTLISELNKVARGKITKLTANKIATGAKTATVSYNIAKVDKAGAYQIQYSKVKSFKTFKSKLVKKTKGTIKYLKKNKKYFIRVRVLRTNYAGVTVYGKWSYIKSVVTKR